MKGGVWDLTELPKILIHLESPLKNPETQNLTEFKNKTKNPNPYNILTSLVRSHLKKFLHCTMI